MRNKKQNSDAVNTSDSQKINISAEAPAENEKEFRLEQILAETRYISERDAMRKAAEKYGARPEMDEIFSTADKKIRLTNNNPLDIDKAPSEEDENTIQGEKNVTTMQAQLMMDSEDEDKIINLTPEIPEARRSPRMLLRTVPYFQRSIPKSERYSERMTILSRY